MKELVLTGYMGFWPKDEMNAVFLGPWCFAGNPKYKFWDQGKFNLASSPWNTHQDILDASRYIDSLVDRITPPIAKLMNEFHSVDYSERFWKIYFMTWLSRWLGNCYDRYMRLSAAESAIEGKMLIKILKEYQYPVKNFSDYVAKSLDHQYNLVLMSDILRHGKFANFTLKQYDASNYLVANHHKTHLPYEKNGTVGMLRNYFKSLVLRYSSSKLYIGDVYGFSLKDKILLQMSLDPLCFIRNIPHAKSRKIIGNRDDLVCRKLQFNALCEFEEIIENIVLRHIPDSLLTIYTSKSVVGRNNRVYVGSDMYLSDKNSFNIAETCENGGKWLATQHGAGYGQFFSFPNGKIEYETSSGFITWGWKHKHIYDSQYYALPSPLLSKLTKKERCSDQVTYVSTIHPAYFYNLHSSLMPENLMECLEGKKIFLLSLNEKLRKKIMYRPYTYDFGIGENEFIGKILNRHQFLTSGKLTTELQKTGVAVIDHMGTSVLEAMAMNVPIILFWDEKCFKMIKAASWYFDKLREAGILFDSPEAAAQKLNSIWTDPNGWWNQQEVKVKREEFSRYFAHASKSWFREWSEFLKSKSM